MFFFNLFCVPITKFTRNILLKTTFVETFKYWPNSIENLKRRFRGLPWSKSMVYFFTRPFISTFWTCDWHIILRVVTLQNARFVLLSCWLSSRPDPGIEREEEGGSEYPIQVHTSSVQCSVLNKIHILI